jgi:hypothetical protein
MNLNFRIKRVEFIIPVFVSVFPGYSKFSQKLTKFKSRIIRYSC